MAPEGAAPADADAWRLPTAPENHSLWSRSLSLCLSGTASLTFSNPRSSDSGINPYFLYQNSPYLEQKASFSGMIQLNAPQITLLECAICFLQDPD